MSKNKFLVLDHGFVQVDRVSDSDQDITRRARISTIKTMKKFSSDEKLIRRLWYDRHTSPFGFPEIVLLIRAPLWIYNQWMRHRTSWPLGDDLTVTYSSTDPTTHQFSDQQMFSGRYSAYEKESMYLPEVDRLQIQSTTNNMGRGDEVLEEAAFIQDQMKVDQITLQAHYDEYLQAGLAREVARINTPLSQYVEWYWKQNLLNTLHWLGLRRAGDAQYEIRVYADVIETIVKEHFPITFKVWDEWSQQVIFTPQEMKELQALVQGRSMNPNMYNKIFKDE